ncbi:MAG: MarR family EPS-associated transcriptional regulator [Spiribacter salinus]|uniref:MarR family EPS-associated transcriptional regulator n=1 Tax=Spiribacter salinus TaxID=1335746 RepID=A0A540VP67_9GAMM|nr:MAG: MarR family EPS-associated transcriptional regulator [Spiribacter salinus]
MMSDIRYQLLRHLEANPEATQRELAAAMGLSVGKTHYALRALIDRGLVKVENFRRADNKRAYLYKLTPAGVAEKVRVARRYLAQRCVEYEEIREEIERLRDELGEHETEVGTDHR